MPALLTQRITALPAWERYARARTKCGTPQLLYCRELPAACGWLAAVAAVRPVLLLCPDPAAAALAAAAVALWGAPVFSLPAESGAPFAPAPDAELPARRALALQGWQAATRGVLVMPATALADSFPAPDALTALLLEFRAGAEYPFDSLRAQLAARGYAPVKLVRAPGEYAVRGGLVDLFPAGAEHPCRLDFTGDRLDDIRLFDAVSQMSLRQLAEVALPPARALPLSPARRRALDALLKQHREPVFAPLREAFNAQAEHPLFALLDRALGAAGGAAAALARPDLLLAAWHPPAVTRALAEAARTLDEMAGRLPFPESFRTALRAHYGEPEEEYARLREGFALDILPPGSDTRQGFTLLSRALPELVAAAGPEVFATRLAAAAGKWRTIAVAVPADREPDTVAAALREQGLSAATALNDDAAGVFVLPGTFPQPLAVELPEAGLLLAAPVPPPPRPLRQHRAWQHSDDTSPVTALFELAPGEFVVHVQFGIGRYLKLERLTTAGMAGDYLKIAYAGGDLLYVPVDKLHLIHKYVGAEREPALNKLRGGNWGAVARRLHASVRDLATELLALHAERLAVPGHAYPAEPPEYERFARAFPHTETFDQAKAIAAVRSDLAAPRPMDRLVCGDVGFGKTEVALRAAFTVMAAGRQVALLCPTTLLAQQHFYTARARLRGFPYTVEVLSRFKSAKEQQRVVALAKRGDIDLLIGTHRLLSADVGFLDLGLVIIDEEQRFGVRHKERFKSLRALVEVLTLTATPIPRTLNIALSGLRDISVIETPPPDKQAVRTLVLPYDPQEEEKAVRAELARGGQVFYVNNRVEELAGLAREVRERYPDARVAVAHGQLPEDELEDVMAAFLHGDYDILVSSAIIESGLDLPRVNTLIVRDAHRFGLADLYQLRGRVGRAKLRATALFCYPPTLPLNETLRDRLEAIESFTDLGAGFQLALRDLEIRGAGNVLGDEQSGLISAVGIPLYTQLLEDEVARREGRATRADEGVALSLPVAAALPADYISDERARLKLYKRLAQCAEAGQLAALRDELLDRFGPLPGEVENLLQLAQVRQGAEQLGLAELTVADGRVTLRFAASRALPAALVAAQGWAAGPKNPQSLVRPWRSAPELLLPVLARDLAAFAAAVKKDSGSACKIVGIPCQRQTPGL